MDVKEAIEILDNPEEFFECEIQLKSGYREASEMAIEALKRTRWIPVSERLPEVANSKVAVIWQDGDVTLCHTRDVAEFIRVTQSSREDYITHWMPLPSAPQEVDL